MSMQNPRHGDKWFCEKCRTWCVPQVPRCSWCGAPRPAPKAPQVVQPKKDEK